MGREELRVNGRKRERKRQKEIVRMYALGIAKSLAFNVSTSLIQVVEVP